MAEEHEIPNADTAARTSRAARLTELLAWQHQSNLRGLIQIYPKDKLLRGSLLPLFFTIVVSIILIIAEVKAEVFLKEIVDSSLSVLPNLLGFLLGGYTILIGFGDVNLLKSTTTIVQGRFISLFQMLSSIFALTIYLQSLTLGIAIVAHFTLMLPMDSFYKISNKLHYLTEGINIVTIPSVLFLLFYSVLSLRDMVMNVFGFAQQYHLSLTQQRMTDEQAARKPTGGDSASQG
jgi:hypothetical protein